MLPILSKQTSVLYLGAKIVQKVTGENSDKKCPSEIVKDYDADLNSSPWTPGCWKQ